MLQQVPGTAEVLVLFCTALIALGVSNAPGGLMGLAAAANLHLPAVPTLAEHL